MASDMERIKAALADEVLCEKIWRQTCVGEGALRFVRYILADAALHTAILKLIREAREECAQRVIWHPQGDAPTDGRLLWMSDGKSVWNIRAHRDGSHNHPSAHLCKFWALAFEPPPPSGALNEEDKHGD